MTNDNKPPMFGPTLTFDPASHVPRSGKSALVNELMAEFAGKPKAVADTIFGNCTTTIPLKFAFDGATSFNPFTNFGEEADQAMGLLVRMADVEVSPEQLAQAKSLALAEVAQGQKLSLLALIKLWNLFPSCASLRRLFVGECHCHEAKPNDRRRLRKWMRK